MHRLSPSGFFHHKVSDFSADIEDVRSVMTPIDLGSATALSSDQRLLTRQEV
jgi:hypothetical protein